MDNKLKSIMSSSASKGLITDLVGGFSKYGGNTADFGCVKELYRIELRKKHIVPVFDNWEVSEWEKWEDKILNGKTNF